MKERPKMKTGDKLLYKWFFFKKIFIHLLDGDSVWLITFFGGVYECKNKTKVYLLSLIS